MERPGGGGRLVLLRSGVGCGLRSLYTLRNLRSLSSTTDSQRGLVESHTQQCEQGEAP